MTSSLLRDVSVTYSAEMRYRGQFFALDTVLPEGALERGDIGAIHNAFHDEHARIYNHRSTNAVDIVALRVRITGRMPTPSAVPLPRSGRSPDGVKIGTRRVRLHGRQHERVPVYDRVKLAPGDRLDGPSLVEQADATILVAPAFSAEIGTFGDIFLTRR